MTPLLNMLDLLCCASLSLCPPAPYADQLIASEGLCFLLCSLRCHNADRINPGAKESRSVNCCCNLSLVNKMLPQADAFRVIKNGLHLPNVKCHVGQSV